VKGDIIFSSGVDREKIKSSLLKNVLNGDKKYEFKVLYKSKNYYPHSGVLFTVRLSPGQTLNGALIKKI